MKNKSWSDLQMWQKCLIVILGSIQIGLLVAALADLRSRPSYMIRGRKLWWVLISFIDIVGPVTYFIYGRKSENDRKDFI